MFRLTPAGRIEAVPERALRVGDVFRREAGGPGRVTRGGWLLVEAVHARVRTRPADEWVRHVALAEDGPAPRVTADEETGSEAVELATPAHALMQAEEGAVPPMESGEIFTGLLDYSFAEAPHPAHVMRRVYQLAYELQVPALHGADPARLGGLRGNSVPAHQYRLKAVIAGTRVQGRCVARHEAMIQATLQLAAARRVARCGEMPALRALLSTSDLLDMPEWETLAEYQQRVSRLREFVGFLFWEGDDPGMVVRRLFSLAKWRQVKSAVLLDMTLANLGGMFGETRACWSWRVKHVVNRFLRAQRVRGDKAGFQKSDTACATYAEVQRGNVNRRGGFRAVS